MNSVGDHMSRRWKTQIKPYSDAENNKINRIAQGHRWGRIDPLGQIVREQGLSKRYSRTWHVFAHCHNIDLLCGFGIQSDYDFYQI